MPEGKSRYSEDEKNTILCKAFTRLRHLNVGGAWAASQAPFTALITDCQAILAASPLAADLRSYLVRHTTVRRAVSMLITYISLAAQPTWQSVAKEMRPLAARGWFLGRWLPTFLLIDGPLNRFLFHSDSPLSGISPAQYPSLCGANEFLNQKTFKSLRNGFAHWSFDWEVIGRESYVIAFDWQNDMPSARLHQEEADAFHIATFSIIEVLDDTLLGDRPQMRPPETGTIQ